jgi:hypothetical protein
VTQNQKLPGNKPIFSIIIHYLFSQVINSFYNTHRLINAREVNQRDGFKAVNPKEPNCNKYVMNITKINPAFTGILTIKASNEFGQAQRQIFLNIHGNF